MTSASRAQASLKSLRVILPIFPLVNVREAEFPVLIRIINAFQESLSLLLLGQMKEELDDASAVAMEVLFQIHDGAIPFLPEGFLVTQFFRQALAAENFRMHPHNQHFLVIGTIEDTDPPAFGKPAGGAPEKIMFQFLGARLFEAEDLAALRIDSGQDMSDDAVLASRVHPLKN